jgi:type I pantothenate kinase
VERSDVGVVAELVRTRSARLVAVTGGVAAGKSTYASALAASLPAPTTVVSTDGFLFSASMLAALGLTSRKGFAESYDARALARFLDRVRAGDAEAWAPRYSHVTADLLPGERAVVGEAEVVVVEGLHLASPALGVRDRFDLVVHLDAADVDLERWYLERFRALRHAAATDPTAYLHPYAGLAGETLDALALDVWRRVNLEILHREVRPASVFADVVLWLDAEHRVELSVLSPPAPPPA